MNETKGARGGVFDSLSIEDLTHVWMGAVEDGNDTVSGYALEVLKRKMVEKVENATGATPADYRYGEASACRQSEQPGFVYVTAGETEYGPVRQTMGAIDFDQEKGTSLVNLGTEEAPTWTKLEYPIQWTWGQVFLSLQQ